MEPRPHGKILDLSDQLVNARPIVQRVWVVPPMLQPTLVTIVRDGRKDVGNYEAIIVNETTMVQTWGKNSRTLLAAAKRRAGTL